MEEQDEWNPSLEGESILKVKVINFNNDVINQNLETYNSQPTPHTDFNNQQDEDKQTKMIVQQQNLYDPLNDQQQQAWVEKKLKKSENYMRPLVCPGCFTALCYQYEKTEEEDINVSKQVVNCKYNPYPIVPIDYETGEKYQKQFMERATNEQLENIKERINYQQQGIDMRFQLECEECQNIVGYYETQNNQYKLISLI